MGSVLNRIERRMSEEISEDFGIAQELQMISSLHRLAPASDNETAADRRKRRNQDKRWRRIHRK